MSETHDENLNQGVGGESVPPTPAPTAPSQGWAPSQDEWKMLQQQNEQMAARIAEYDQMFAPEQPEEELDLSDPYTLARVIDAVVEQRLAGVTPYVRNAAQDQGKRYMETLFNDLEKEIGSFDRNLAERTAFYFFERSGDAEGSVREAAQYAADVRKSERDAGVADMRSRATRRGKGASDEIGEGSATPAVPPAKTYDEVIERYTHQTEL